MPLRSSSLPVAGYNKRMKELMLVFALSALTLLSACHAPEAVDETTEREKPVPDTVQLTPGAVTQSKLTLMRLLARPEAMSLHSTAMVKMDENRLFHISSFVSGRVIQENAELGQTVRAGQTLAVVQNLEVAKIQANYIHELHSNEIEVSQARTIYGLAQSKLQRERQMWQEGVSPQRDYQQAVADEKIAKTDLEGKLEHRLHLRSETGALLSAYGLKPTGAHTERITTGSPIHAPKGGVLVKKNVTVGDMVTPETVMYEVADLSQVWLDMTIYPQDIEEVRAGQPLTFTTDSVPGKVFSGQVDYVQPSAQSGNATYVARAYLHNPDALLKPGIYGQARIDRQLTENRLIVPEAAVQRYGRETFVFTPVGNNRFHKQTVILGEKVTDGFVLREGLSADAQVVGNGSFVLKAELLKTQFAESD